MLQGMLATVQDLDELFPIPTTHAAKEPKLDERGDWSMAADAHSNDDSCSDDTKSPSGKTERILPTRQSTQAKKVVDYASEEAEEEGARMPRMPRMLRMLRGCRGGGGAPAAWCKEKEAIF